MVRGYLVILSIVFVTLQGCVAVQSYPTVARAGDTITLSVGSPEGMHSTNTTVQFIPDSDPGNSIDITSSIRAMPKIYPDKRSTAWLGSPESLAPSIPNASGHGPWLQLIVLDLPASLPTGTGQISVTVPPSVIYPEASANINNNLIGIEIIPGTGVPNPFRYQAFNSGGSSISPLSLFEPNSHVEVRMPRNATRYGAVELVVNAPIISDLGNPIIDQNIKVIFDDQPGNHLSQRQGSWYRNGDNFTINVLSPLGLMNAYEARCYIVLRDFSTVESYSFNGAPSLISIRYFDELGAEVTGPVPQINLR